MKVRSIIPTLFIGCVVLGGCNRSGSGTPMQAKGALAPPGAQSAAPYRGPRGIFDTPNSTFDSIVTVIDSGEIYGMDVIDGRVAGFYHGTASGTNAAITSKAIEYNAMDGGYIQDLDFSAEYKNPSLQVTLVFPFGTFDGTATGQEPYAKGDPRSIYSNPAPVASLAGSYDGELSSVGSSMETYSKAPGLVISSNGTFFVTAGDCRFSGRLSQHGKTGVYDIAAQAAGTACPLSGRLKGLMTPITLAANRTTLGFQMLAPDARKSAMLYVTKGE